MSYWTTYTIILITGLAIGGGLLACIQRYWKSAILKYLAENVTIALLSIFITFMAAELFFVFFAQTDNLNFTLASKNWFTRYWSVNSMGYRDVEWNPEKIRHQRKIIILGDSFTAGYGIKNVEDRFSNILGKKLGDDYVVMNVARNGAETPAQIEMIKAFPYKPDILILQYYINDIQDAAKKKAVDYNPPKLYPWPVFSSLVQNSYALNFIYWRSVRFGPYIWQGDYLAWAKEAYNNPDIWWFHQQELLTIYEGALSEKVKLIVVVFPALTDVEGTRPLTAKVVNLYRERGIQTLDIAELVENIPPEDLVVSALDSHPNQRLHRQVADMLYEMVIQIEQIEPPQIKSSARDDF